MSAFAEASRTVGFEAPQPIPYPTGAELDAAIADANLIYLLTWHRFLPAPKSEWESTARHQIARTLLQLSPDGTLEEATAPLPSAADPAVAGERATCLLCAKRYHILDKLSWLSVNLAKGDGICNFCGPYVAEALLNHAHHPSNFTRAEHAGDILVSARMLARLAKRPAAAATKEEVHVDY